MINEKEIQAVELSPTKKDFYQIWNELLETASKISERWDPTSTNESDPGIVLLKVLAALGDKLNYNIDKNTLEAFMPSATQQESMRKLCDMMGYNMKYYGSATTSVTIKYIGEDWPNTGSIKTIIIPKYSTLTDRDNKISYVTLNQLTFTNDETNQIKFITDSVNCIEGQICTCENNGNTNKLITISQLDDNFRYYLPETQIAENGIFIYSGTIENSELVLNDEEWRRVDNLNTQSLESKCFKVGFDSKKNIPYIQFPKDVSSLIGDGLRIMYIRTNGINGNISANTLAVLSEPDMWKNSSDSVYNKLSTDNFVVTNPSAATNGYNPESIDSAYNNYKKTIGTFDTLVTCRDYMNKIYQLTEDDVNTTPLVSNVIVSDIRDDINRSYTLCEFSDYGIKYVDKTYKDDDQQDLINHFDLVLYPFRTIATSNSEESYVNSFKYSAENNIKIENDLEKYKTISHSIKYPKEDEIVCIKNYLKLNAKITTVLKVNTTEEISILSSIYNAIYNNFNLRKLDFGESIPFDDILACIENADTRIKNVSLDEPILYTVFVTADNTEYSIENSISEKLLKAKAIYNKLALRNILAGKIALFNYNEDFKYEYSEKNNSSYDPIYPTPSSSNKIISLQPELTLNANTLLPYTLNDNEVIQFRAPSFKTSKTYPAYVNYFIHLNDDSSGSSDEEEGIPASFKSMQVFLREAVGANDRWDSLFTLIDKDKLKTESGIVSSNFDQRLDACGAFWNKVGSTYNRVKTWTSSTPSTLYYIPFTETTFPTIYSYVVSQDLDNSSFGKYSGIYRSLGWNADRVPGYLVTSDKVKYRLCNSFIAETYPLTAYFVQQSSSINDGLGKDAVLDGIKKNSEYELKPGEYLLINYTEASNSADTSGEKIIRNIIYLDGTIIRPNFLLKDSIEEKELGKHNYDKTSGYSFESYNIPGMYSLGSSEQIEIRDRAQLTLGMIEKDDGTQTFSNVYIYWDLLDEDKLLDETTNTIKFPWVNNKYTLKAGEYFYFTDDSKLDMSYYGAGTEIIRKGNLNIDKVRRRTAKLSTDELLSAGISSIDWWKISPNNVSNITFVEYQYINLVKDDKLTEFEESTQALGTIIDKVFNPCSSAKYIISGSNVESSLPKIDVTSIDGTASQLSWEVKSILQLNVGPTQTQTLHENNKLTIIYADSITPEEIDIGAGQTLSLKSNYLCQSSSDVVDVRIGSEDSVSGQITWSNDFKLKTFDDNSLKIINGLQTTPVQLHNFGEYWTKVSMKEFTLNTSILNLNINLPNESTTYGLVMIHLISSTSTITDQPYITIDTGTYTPKIFNNNNQWWSGRVDATKYYLKEGTNIIYVNKSTTLTIHPDTAKEANIIIADLDIINYTNVNPYGISLDTIKYQLTDAVTYTDAGSELLHDISILDTNQEFYYNCRIENSDAIDINTSIDSQTNKPIETLASPYAWYDYNNINNKFVVSEIDSTYMKKYGISIARSSKR